MRSPRDFDAWVIAYAGAAGQGYVGQLANGARIGASSVDVVNGWVDLETPYVLASGYVITPQGQVARPMMLFPVEMLVGSLTLRVHYNALLRLRDLDGADFTALSRSLEPAIEQAEALRSAVQSQRSGILLAPAGAKLPPMMPRRE